MQEVILMVGIQGSGKSFIAEQYLKKANYEVVSNDKSGGRDKVKQDLFIYIFILFFYRFRD